MTTAVLTRPDFFPGEAEHIARLLLSENVRWVHIRKPGAPEERVAALLDAVPVELHGRLTLHDQFSLIGKYGIGGVHLNRRSPVAPEGWGGRVSRSCHSLEEVTMWKDRCDYVSLSPIFDSVSKQGYLSAFTAEEITGAKRSGILDEKVYALGGVTFARLDEVARMGFGGAMILGDAWKQFSL